MVKDKINHTYHVFEWTHWSNGCTYYPFHWQSHCISLCKIGQTHVCKGKPWGVEMRWPIRKVSYQIFDHPSVEDCQCILILRRIPWLNLDWKQFLIPLTIFSILTICLWEICLRLEIYRRVSWSMWIGDFFDILQQTCYNLKNKTKYHMEIPLNFCFRMLQDADPSILDEGLEFLALSKYG